ncbi:MAG TPA: hypothetical protein VN700_09255 [Vicinamibacterales bacterium]|nr:hypothetical protein [Vicinamibacterales bacterium]
MPHRPKSTCLVLLVAIALAAPLRAQNRANFAGKWVLVLEKSTPAIPERHQREITITQEAQSITMTQIAYTVSGVFSPGSRGGVTNTPPREEFQYSITYEFDGADHPTPKVEAPNPRPTPSMPPTAIIQVSQRLDSIYRATWTRDQLVIMTRESTTTATPSSETHAPRAVSRKALSLDPDGLLVIDSIRVADPTPNGPTQPAPMPVHSVYRKAS